MNRLKLPVAVLAAFGFLSLSLAAQSTQDNKSNAGTSGDTSQAASATAQDSEKPQTAAEKKAAEKAAKEKAKEEARAAKKNGTKPESDDAKRKDTDAIGDRDVGKGVNFYSLDKEIALGKQLAQEVERQAKVVDDPIIAEYVNRIGQNLVRNSDAKVPFTIKVLDTEEVNAFALPGGFFFVNSGLIFKADTEAELAGVMAHEIAHVAAGTAPGRPPRATSRKSPPFR